MKTAGCEHQIYSIAEDMLYALRSRVLTSRKPYILGQLSDVLEIRLSFAIGGSSAQMQKSCNTNYTVF